MRCPNCRVESEATDFCSNCGAQLPTEVVATQLEQSFELEPLPAPEPVRTPRRTGAQQREWDTVLHTLTHEPDPNAAADGLANNSGTGGPAPQEVIAMGYCWPAFVFKRWWCFAHHIPMTWQSQMFGGLGNSLPDKGYVLAWQHRRFESLQQFRDTMKAWQTGAKWVPIAIGAIVFLRIMGGFGHHGFR